jgi:hypothetical protein
MNPLSSAERMAGDAVALCEAVGLETRLVRAGASSVAVEVRPRDVDLPDLVARLYRAMRDQQTDWYQVEHHLLPGGNTLDELRFRPLPSGGS